MKKILITGENSYIGLSVKEWVSKNYFDYTLETISLRNNEWKKKDFSMYDSIIHTVGIAHVDSNPDKSLKGKYYEINRDLAIEVAKKAKRDGVSQFIFLSSIIVYGNKNSYITIETPPNPENFYGDSKLQAEEGILNINDENFKVAIIRLPMIYGYGSKGNYPLLAKLARITPLFPKISNKRSMLHIDNLCEFLYLIIKNQESGLFWPQNQEYVNTSELVWMISKAHGKFILLTSLFNPIVNLLTSRYSLFKKVFGDIVYSKDMSSYKENYNVRNFEESIKLTEKRR